MKLIGRISHINGPLISIELDSSVCLMEMVFVSDLKFVGEILSIKEKTAIVQVYETTEGIRLDDPVFGSGLPLSVELGPGLLSSIFDGIQRPLSAIAEVSQSIYLERGIFVPALDRKKKWLFHPLVAIGDKLSAGDILGWVPETEVVKHQIMVPPDISGTIRTIVSEGEFTVDEVIAEIEIDDKVIHKLKLFHRWPVKSPRPYKERYLPSEPMITGQRIIDVFFPVAKGSAVAIPGGFGTGKTIIQHQLAKWSDVKIVVYVGCGERGNEITEVLETFPKLVDPHSNRPLSERTVMIANTSNMPVTAREASIYTGITIAEYYRDMGYDVAVMADSSSRWAEALRELSGRLEEIPVEEGFPAYLGSKLASFYERAGTVQVLNGKRGSLTVIAAVSPPGGDFSEPVTQNTKRFIRAFWQLDKALASTRHYPSINWVNSYSEYTEYVDDWWIKNVDKDSVQIRQEAYDLLMKQERLQKIVKLIGAEALPDNERIILEVFEMIKEGFLKQNAYDKIDMYSSPKKQIALLKMILQFFNTTRNIVALGAPIFEIRALESFFLLMRARLEIANEDFSALDKLNEFITKELAELFEKYNKIKQEET